MSFPPLRDKAEVGALVSTDWVAERLGEPGLRIVECNEDFWLYSAGHIPGACELDWRKDLNDHVVRDVVDHEEFQELCGKLGITPDTTLVFYGDRGNWWACYACWVFHLFGHTNAVVMDGGRTKWLQEQRPLTPLPPTYPRTTYSCARRDDRSLRAFREDVLLHVVDKGVVIDVRSKGEFLGEAPLDGKLFSALRYGRIPAALSLPWELFVRQEDSTFKSPQELTEVLAEHGVHSWDDIITYCWMGERSSLAWFVMKKLLGWSNVRNYDGGWAEWGNAIGLPIQRGS